MPEVEVPRLCRADGMVTVVCGRRVLFHFAEADLGMRNLVMVALADGGVPGVVVAGLFGLSADHFSTLRVRVRRGGSVELIRQQGRPPKLSGVDQAKARRWAAEGMTGRDIAKRLGVSEATVSRLLAGVGVATELAGGPLEDPVDDANLDGIQDAEDADADASSVGGLARLDGVEVSCRYAGAMLLHPFLSQIGVGEVFARLGSGPARRYDTTAVVLCAMFGLTLGESGSLEAIKHVGRCDLGALAGVRIAPELATMRARLAAVADGCDPVLVQAALTRALIATAAPAEQVFFIDDHFVAYSGAAPVAKGWNTKRRHAQPGRDDTYICDLVGRALCFTSSEPSGLSVTMRQTVTELAKVCPAGTPITLGFDRGGSFPVAFSWLRDQDITWLTWRRGRITPTTTSPRRSWFKLDGIRHTYQVVDEIIDLVGYGSCRQVTLYENGEPVAQVLTSDLASTPARLVHLLKCRWRIENAFKYLTEHHGIDWLCDYRKTLITDERPVRNPDRTAARTALNDLKTVLAATEQTLGATLATAAHSGRKLAELSRLGDRRAMIIEEIDAAKIELRSHRAKLKANDLDSTAVRALLVLRRRNLQMVLRLLAYNAELWLADRFNAYLCDPDEYRAITRHLLHQPGTITYTPTEITVTIQRPDQPRVARALQLLATELNHTPARIPGDNRPLNYQLSP